MKISKALELYVQYHGDSRAIKIDENGYMCLNDLNAFFPNKRVQPWLDNARTKEYIAVVERNLIDRNSGELESGIVARKGRHKSGTYAHKWIAMKFAMWLDAEFELMVIQGYESGTQRKQDWNIIRILAANNYKIMAEPVKNAHDDPRPYHFSNEALMLNELCFGVREPIDRNSITERQLEDMSWLESHNTAYIDLGMDYQARRARLTELFGVRQKKLLPAA
jgi:hypothetical protein